jgi:phosphocarrier protein HPr
MLPIESRAFPGAPLRVSIMFEATLEITAESGLHTRPASIFVQAAKAFQSDITVVSGDKTANAKSLFKLQTLGLSKGASITIRADGPDAERAVRELAVLVAEVKE